MSNLKIKQDWMKSFELEFIKITLWMNGRVDWDTATYLFNEGFSAADAASKLHDSHCSLPNRCDCVPF